MGGANLKWPVTLANHHLWIREQNTIRNSQRGQLRDECSFQLHTEATAQGVIQTAFAH